MEKSNLEFRQNTPPETQELGMSMKTRRVGTPKQADSAPVKGPVTDWDRVVALHGMFTSFAVLMSARMLLPFVHRVKDAPDRADFEAAKAEFQKELDRHK